MWYTEKLAKIKKEYEKTDPKFTKKQTDLMQQLRIIEDILR